MKLQALQLYQSHSLISFIFIICSNYVETWDFYLFTARRRHVCVRCEPDLMIGYQEYRNNLEYLHINLLEWTVTK